MTKKEQINFPPIAKKFKTEGYKSCPYNHLEKSELKLVLYGVSSPFTEKIVKPLYENRSEYPPFGLLTNNGQAVDFKDLDFQFPFLSIAKFMKDIIAQNTRKTFEQDDQTQDAVFQENYEGLKELLSFLSIHGDSFAKLKYRTGPSGFMTNGSDFATLGCARFADVIPRLTPKSASYEQTGIAKNSYPLLVKLSTGSLEKVVAIVNGLLLETDKNKFQFNVEYFRIVNKKGRSQLGISQKGNKRLKELGLSLNNLKSRDPFDMCPAAVNFGEGSAVKILWDWYVEIASKIYSNF